VELARVADFSADAPAALSAAVAAASATFVPEKPRDGFPFIGFVARTTETAVLVNPHSLPDPGSRHGGSARPEAI
jgi:hypothetical protein